MHRWMHVSQLVPFSSASKHSNVISNSYLSVNLAGLFSTFTPNSETTDMLMEYIFRKTKRQVCVEVGYAQLGLNQSNANGQGMWKVCSWL